MPGRHDSLPVIPVWGGWDRRCPEEADQQDKLWDWFRDPSLMSEKEVLLRMIPDISLGLTCACPHALAHAATCTLHPYVCKYAYKQCIPCIHKNGKRKKNKRNRSGWNFVYYKDPVPFMTSAFVDETKALRSDFSNLSSYSVTHCWGRSWLNLLCCGFLPYWRLCLAGKCSMLK